MLPINELRKGNYFLTNLDEPVTPRTVDGFNRERIYFADGYYSVEEKDAYPIPISVDWLKRFGFERDNEGTFEFYHPKTGFTINDQFNFYAGSSLEWRSVHYVHQLQNLIFSLTGTELTLKP